MAFGKTKSFQDFQDPDDERTEGVKMCDSDQWHNAGQGSKLLVRINVVNVTGIL